MKTPFKAIKLWADEKAVLSDALSNVIENIYGKKNEMSRIYKDIADKLDKSLMVSDTDGTYCILDIYGGAYEACIFALKCAENPNAEELLTKIRNAPNKAKAYY